MKNDLVEVSKEVLNILQILKVDFNPNGLGNVHHFSMDGLLSEKEGALAISIKTVQLLQRLLHICRGFIIVLILVFLVTEGWLTLEFGLNLIGDEFLEVNYSLLDTLDYFLALELEVEILRENFLAMTEPIDKEMEGRFNQFLVDYS